MPKINLFTTIDAPRPLVFDLARDISIHAETVPWTRERAVGQHTTGKLDLGDIVVFEATHFGVRQRLTARITEFDYPFYFGDVMVSGAFSALTHRHYFAESDNNVTVMTDELDFTSPLGPIGRIADLLFLESYMRTFLQRRNANLKQIAEVAARRPQGV